MLKAQTMTQDFVELLQKLKAGPQFAQQFFCSGDFVGHHSDDLSKRARNRALNVKTLFDPIENSSSQKLPMGKEVCAVVSASPP